MKSALITGITGQDGSYLAELLLQKGYRVFGFCRRESWLRPHCASHLASEIEVFFGDMAEGVDIADAIQKARPDEIYNLASQSRPGESWARSAETLRINGLAALQLFEAARHHCPEVNIYHASSSEMFGAVSVCPQDESTPFNPVNPYAAAKVYAHQMAQIYRASYGLRIACGILYNHESERRPLHFLTQKVAYGAACASLGVKDSPALNEVGRPIVSDQKLSLGNLDVERDWGYAADFVRAMWLMLQAEKPDDYVIGTGILHSLQDLCAAAYASVGLDWRNFVVSDPQLIRPLETRKTKANWSKAALELGWKPETPFATMIERMVAHQLAELTKATTKTR
jgi:GDPmannose 4,6-dehydratase